MHVNDSYLPQLMHTSSSKSIDWSDPLIAAARDQACCSLNSYIIKDIFGSQHIRINAILRLFSPILRHADAIGQCSALSECRASWSFGGRSFGLAPTEFSAILLRGHPLFLAKIASHVFVTRVSKVQGNLGYGQIGLQQHPRNPFDPDSPDLVVYGPPEQFPKAAFQDAPRHGDIADDVGYLDRLVGMQTDEADGVCKFAVLYG